MMMRDKIYVLNIFEIDFYRDDFLSSIDMVQL